MSLIEFSYANTFQRKLVYINNFAAFTILSFIFTDATGALSYYFFHSPVFNILGIIIMAGIFSGNLSARFVLSKISKSRIIYIITDILFTSLASLFLLRKIIYPLPSEPVMALFTSSTIIPVMLLFIFGFLAGLKVNYFLKICTGSFIDERNGINGYIISTFAGITAGIGSAFIFLIYNISTMTFTPMLLPVLAASFIISFPYNPSTMFARDFKEDTPSTDENPLHRDDAFFTYINISSIIIYIYMTHTTVIKFYGDFYYIKLFFALAVFIFLIIGYAAGKKIRRAFWHIYSEMLFPVSFLVTLFLLFNFNSSLYFYTGILLTAPSFIIFGFSISHTVNNIMKYFPHGKRFNIIDFSTVVIPLPVIAALVTVEFTYLVYFIIIYLLAIVNILMPGIYLAGTGVKPYKKSLYLGFSLFFVPAIIAFHLYNRIPLSSELYAPKIKNYEIIKQTNYNANYLKNSGDVYYNGIEIFSLTDSNIRNLKRSIVPLLLYTQESDRILFIDSNQKFFRNPVLANFKSAKVIEPVSNTSVDNNKLPFSGSQRYVAESNEIFNFIKNDSAKYSAIVDIPNITDQKKNFFRCSEEYFNLIKSRLTPEGIIVQIIDTSVSDSGFAANSAINLKKIFKKHAVYLFSNIAVIISTNSDATLLLSEKKYSGLSAFIKTSPDALSIFYSEQHMLSHYLTGNIEDFIKIFPVHKFERLPFAEEVKNNAKIFIGEAVIKSYMENNRKITETVNPQDWQFLNSLSNSIAQADRTLTLLKKTEYSEFTENYQEETSSLFELKKTSDYVYDVRNYIWNILSYKEEYYINAAIRYEKEKKWDEARNLYLAILSLNPNNFETNYRMGIISITVQDLDNAALYLQNAMRLKNEHPKVLYQMGVLKFLLDKPAEAIEYLNRSLQQREKSPMLYFYLGLSYEKLNNPDEAEANYLKALIEDPNDPVIKARIETIKKFREDEKNKWNAPELKNETDSERDEDIPLPINKSAFDIRLGDKEMVDKETTVDGVKKEEPKKP